MLRLATALTMTVAAALASVPAVSADAASNRVVFHVYDANGDRLDWAQFRALEDNGKGGNGQNDMWLNPSTLAVIAGWPLYSTGGASGDPTATWPGRPASLSLAWPTSDGYSNLILDVPGPGTYNFTLLAARQAVASLDQGVAARPAYQPSTAFRLVSGAAHSQLAAANAAGSEAQQGADAARALDAAVHADLTMLAEYGAQFAASHSSLNQQSGVTIDDIAGGVRTLQNYRNVVGNSAHGWVRVVFDRSEPPRYYANEISSAHALGLRVVGQILDSSDMSSVSLAQWQQRVAHYVSVLPTVDEWEVGNEVNGNWLGSGVAAKVSYAAQYVKQHTHARTLVTLYWQLGEDNPQHSMFNWARANLTSTILRHVDDIGISLYVEDHPMGLAFDRVMGTLHREFPQQRLGITELDYWSPDLGHTWWWGSETDPTGTGRTDVASLYQSAVFGYPYSFGGGYWWYYVEEAQPGTPLAQTLHAAAADTPLHW